MQKGPLRAIARIIFWRFQRGSWQYDILCGLILLFIFLTPRSVFDGSFFSAPDEKAVEEANSQGAAAVNPADSETRSIGVEGTEARLETSE